MIRCVDCDNCVLHTGVNRIVEDLESYNEKTKANTDGQER